MKGQQLTIGWLLPQGRQPRLNGHSNTYRSCFNSDTERTLLSGNSTLKRGKKTTYWVLLENCISSVAGINGVSTNIKTQSLLLLRTKNCKPPTPSIKREIGGGARGKQKAHSVSYSHSTCSPLLGPSP
eukprot:scaffold244085_cov15-Tisochrysis_lutea.AAC.1